MPEDWKTIDYRQRKQRNSRRQQKYGIAAAGAGATLATGGAVLHGDARDRGEFAPERGRYTPGGKYGARGEPVSNLLRGKEPVISDRGGRLYDQQGNVLEQRSGRLGQVGRGLRGKSGLGFAGLLAGAGAMGGGAAWAGGHRGREAWHENRIGARRRANAARRQPVGKRGAGARRIVGENPDMWSSGPRHRPTPPKPQPNYNAGQEVEHVQRAPGWHRAAGENMQAAPPRGRSPRHASGAFYAAGVTGAIGTGAGLGELERRRMRTERVKAERRTKFRDRQLSKGLRVVRPGRGGRYNMHEPKASLFERYGDALMGENPNRKVQAATLAAGFAGPGVAAEGVARRERKRLTAAERTLEQRTREVQQRRVAKAAPPPRYGAGAVMASKQPTAPVQARRAPAAGGSARPVSAKPITAARPVPPIRPVTPVRPAPVMKAARRYDDELQRRYRLGAATAGAAGLGAAGLGYAAREGRDATRMARSGAPFGPHRGNVRAVELDDVEMGNGKVKVKGRFINGRAVHVSDRLGKTGLAITRRGGLAGVGGLASLGGAAALHRRSKQPHWN